MNKKSLLLSILACSHFGLSLAEVKFEPDNNNIIQYISTLPSDKKQIAEYVIKNNPNYSCFNYSSLENITQGSPASSLSKEVQYVCGLTSKASFIEDDKTVSIKVKGQSFSINDDIQIPKILDNNNQDIKPIKVLFKNNEAEYVALPSEKRAGAKKLERGEWLITFIYSKNKFSNVKSIAWDIEKNPSIIDMSKYSKEFTRSGETLIIKEKSSIAQSESTLEKPNKNEIKVFRKLERTTPYILDTIIEINNYKDQESINLGKINPSGFHLLNISRNIKIQENNGDYIATLGLGKNTILMQAVSHLPVYEYKAPMVNGVDEEIWSISTKGSLVEIKGLEATNAKIADIPNQWRNLPTYVRSGDFSLIEAKNQLENPDLPITTELTRNTWFDSKGNGYSTNNLKIINNPSNVQFITQNNNNVNISGLILGNEPQVILEKNGKTLIPLKNNNQLNYSFESNDFSIPMNIWDTNENLNSWKINLSPRTRLVTSTDEMFSGSWIDSWTLYSVFFLVLLVVAYWKIINTRMALLVGISTVLLVSLSKLIWLWWVSFLLFLLIKKGLVYLQERKVDDVNVNKISRQIILLALLFTIILSVGSFQTYKLIVSEIQYVINPSLELKSFRTSPVEQSVASYEVMRDGVSNMADSISMSKIASTPASAPYKIKESSVKSYQVGRPEPVWNSYFQNYIFFKGNVSSISNSTVKLYVAPIWLVNIVGIFQILISLLLMALGWILTYVLLSKNQKAKNSRFYQFFFKEV